MESRNLSLLPGVEPLECLVRVRYRPVAYDSRCIGHLAPFGSDQLTGSDGIYLAPEPHKKATLSPTIVRGISPLCIGQFPRSPTRPGLASQLDERFDFEKNAFPFHETQLFDTFCPVGGRLRGLILVLSSLWPSPRRCPRSCLNTWPSKHPLADFWLMSCFLSP